MLIRQHGLGRQLARLVEGRERIVEPIQPQQDQAPQLVRGRMIRFQLERLVDVGERFVELVLAVAVLRADAIVVRLVRHQLDRFVEIRCPLLLVGLQRAAERERLGPVFRRRHRGASITLVSSRRAAFGIAQRQRLQPAHQEVRFPQSCRRARARAANR